jgi:beta-mannosidase
MGSLYWQLNDCWPVASWSGIDYYGKWKALHYFVREAFKPTILVCSEDHDSLKVMVISDHKKIGKMKLEIRAIKFSGKVLWKHESLLEMPSQEINFLSDEILAGTDPASVVLVSDLKNDDEVIDRDLHYFVQPKDLKLINPQIITEIVDAGDEFEISVSAKYLAKNVFLYADHLNDNFSDNFFDILPGESISVKILKDTNSVRVLQSLDVIHLYLTGN